MVKLSIIVIFHNMRREAARTLHSLSTRYQNGITSQEYEVIVIDNGSDQPLDFHMVAAHGDNFSYHFLPTESLSPAEAMNYGARLAKGEVLAFIVDGARMATPGLLASSLKALALAKNPFVAGLCWHLGPNIQNISMLNGYDQSTEDALLKSIDWPKRPYQLFNISTIAPSSNSGFMGGMPPECSWLCLPHTSFADIGGYEEKFQSPGGGLVNHDFRNRAISRAGATPIVLLGEGLFHQFHGGVATNVPKKQHPFGAFKKEYEAIRGEPYKPTPCPDVLYVGRMPPETLRFIIGKSAN